MCIAYAVGKIIKRLLCWNAQQIKRDTQKYIYSLISYKVTGCLTVSIKTAKVINPQLMGKFNSKGYIILMAGKSDPPP